MYIENNLKDTTEKENILSLISRGRTNIESVKILTHYEFVNDSKLRFHNITDKIQDFQKNISEKEYNIFEAVISENGDISNYKLRLNDNRQILNEVNILNYVTSEVPREMKNKYEVNDTHIYIIRYFNFEKKVIQEEDVDAIIDDGGLVIQENGDFIFLEKNYKNSIQKYWTEDPLKAIFKLKKDGFYLGTNSPDINENLELLNEFIYEDEIIMFTNQNIVINKMKINAAEIEKVKIPFKLSEIIKKKFQKRDNYIPRQKSVVSLYKTNEPQDFNVDYIDPKIDKIKLPRR